MPLTRRAFLVNALIALPALSVPGCTPWRVIRRSPHNPLASHREFALAQIDFAPSAVAVSERESEAMVSAIRERMEGHGRPFDVFPAGEAPPTAFALGMGITIQRLHRGQGAASMRLTIVEPNGAFDQEATIVDQIDMASDIEERGHALMGLVYSSAPNTRLMRDLGRIFADRTRRYLRERTSERV